MLTKMLTGVSDVCWNSRTQHFDTHIFSTDPDTGERILVDYYATPPHIFMAFFAAQVEAIKSFEADKTGADVVDIKLHG